MDIRKPNKTATQPEHVASRPRSEVKAPSRPYWTRPLVVLVVLIVAIAAVIGLRPLQSAIADQAVDKNRFQAVFLTNGQVYFGKLSGISGDYVNVKNIYYLQVQQSVQPSTDKPAKNGTDGDSQVSLTKLGKELHGPTDEMHISKDQVLFWENLEEESTVVKAIKEYETKK